MDEQSQGRNGQQKEINPIVTNELSPQIPPPSESETTPTKQNKIWYLLICPILFPMYLLGYPSFVQPFLWRVEDTGLANGLTFASWVLGMGLFLGAIISVVLLISRIIRRKFQRNIAQKSIRLWPYLIIPTLMCVYIAIYFFDSWVGGKIFYIGCNPNTFCALGHFILYLAAGIPLLIFSIISLVIFFKKKATLSKLQ